jgi:hypothetical protein
MRKAPLAILRALHHRKCARDLDYVGREQPVALEDCVEACEFFWVAQLLQFEMLKRLLRLVAMVEAE